MFRNCIYCNASLGTNEAVETFTAGRRLAFDSERGRLWVICRRCRRWNLSPLEERWEAIEECERLFHDTPLRYSTDQIGLARLPEGLDLVRVGRPERREFAAWRYGRIFVRRRVRRVVTTAARWGAIAAGAQAGVWLPFLFVRSDRRVVARLHDDQGRRLSVTRGGARKLRLLSGWSGDDWQLAVNCRLRERRGLIFSRGSGPREVARLSGPTAIHAAGLLLPRVNAWGGSRSQVDDAVRLIDQAGRPDRLYALGRTLGGSRELVGKMPAGFRLALEMAAHEEGERRALEGELARLESAWREAEEIASIADRLLIPQSIEDFILRYRDRLTGRGEGRTSG